MPHRQATHQVRTLVTLVALVAAMGTLWDAPTLAAGQPPQASTGLRLLLIGIDGADWQIADPLIQQGRLPNLAQLKKTGAWASLRSTTPMLSPLLWNSMATGRTPIEHGIIDFLVKDPQTGRRVPISSAHRKTKALWNIYSEAGLTSDFIAWWATWPAESIHGHMISDRLDYSLFGFRSTQQDLPGLVSPPEYLATTRSLRVTQDAITLLDLQRFAPFTASDMAAARARITEDPAQAFADPLNHLVRVLASTRTYHAIALDLLARKEQDVLSIYYQGIDEICHRYAHFITPRLDWVDLEDFEKFHDVVARYYEYQDALIGELLKASGKDMTVMVVSDHGFLNGSDRPEYSPNLT